MGKVLQISMPRLVKKSLYLWDSSGARKQPLRDKAKYGAVAHSIVRSNMQSACSLQTLKLPPQPLVPRTSQVTVLQTGELGHTTHHWQLELK